MLQKTQLVSKNTFKEFSQSLREKKRTKSWALKEKTNSKNKEKILKSFQVQKQHHHQQQ